jgi:hypothetical protein
MPPRPGAARASRTRSAIPAQAGWRSTRFAWSAGCSRTRRWLGRPPPPSTETAGCPSGGTRGTKPIAPSPTSPGASGSWCRGAWRPRTASSDGPPGGCSTGWPRVSGSGRRRLRERKEPFTRRGTSGWSWPRSQRVVRPEQHRASRQEPGRRRPWPQRCSACCARGPGIPAARRMLTPSSGPTWRGRRSSRSRVPRAATSWSARSRSCWSGRDRTAAGRSRERSLRATPPGSRPCALSSHCSSTGPT